MQPVKMADIFGISFLSDVKLSPNGKYAAFVTTKGSLEENNYSSFIWLYSIENEKLTRLTGGGAEKRILWLDNETVVFPAARLEKDKEIIKKNEPVTSYYSINIHGGEAEKLFTVPAKATRIQNLDAGKFLVTATYDHYAPDFSSMSQPEKDKALADMTEADASYKIFDEIPFWQNGQGVTNKKRSRLYIFDSSNQEFKPISPPLMNVESAGVSEDSMQIFFAGAEFEHMMLQKSLLYVHDRHKNETARVELGGEFLIDHVAAAGDKLLFVGKRASDYNSYSNPEIFSVPSSGGTAELFYNADFSVGSSVSSDCKFGGGPSTKYSDGCFYYISTRGYSSYLYKLSGNAEGSLISPNVSGSVDCFDISGGICAYIGVREKGLQELYLIDLQSGEHKCATGLNKAWLEDHDISYPEHFVFTNRDGVELDGFIIKPVGFDPNKTYPGILDMHGGPKVAFGDVLFHEMQLWAGEGYFVFFTNPRGSDGKGSEFANIIEERYCNWDYNDFMDFTDKALEICPQLDKDRLGVTGGSYGGLMTNWIIGQTDRFKAAASQRSISNFISKCLTTDIGYYHNLTQIGATPWEDIQAFWDHSPLKYADKCVTPTLFIHSDEDYRCYMADALQMFTALKMHGCEARLCLFHGENHELSRSGKPKNRMKRLDEITTWFNSHLK